MGLAIEDTPETMTQSELERMESGNLVPEGEYFATLMDVEEIVSNEKGTEGLEFSFEIDDGQFTGTKIKDTLWETDSNKARKRIFECKLGILKWDTAKGMYVRDTSKTSWKDCCGERVKILVEVENYERKNGTKGQKNKLKYGGVKRLDEPAAKELKAASVGANGAASAPPSAAAKAKIPDDL